MAVSLSNGNSGKEKQSCFQIQRPQVSGKIFNLKSEIPRPLLFLPIPINRLQSFFS